VGEAERTISQALEGLVLARRSLRPPPSDPQELARRVAELEAVVAKLEGGGVPPER
jgi:hypothetical protein